MKATMWVCIGYVKVGPTRAVGAAKLDLLWVSHTGRTLAFDVGAWSWYLISIPVKLLFF